MKNPTKDDEEIVKKDIGKESAQNGGAGDPSTLGYEGHKLELEDFTDAVRNKRKPLVDGYEARKAVEIIEAIYKSSREGGKVITLALEV